MTSTPTKQGTENEMTYEEELAWGTAEHAARMEDLKDRTPSGLQRAQANAEARRKAVGLSRARAASLVLESSRVRRVADFKARGPSMTNTPTAPMLGDSGEEAEKPLSDAQRKTLERAVTRPTGFICPIRGPGGAAETALIEALRRKGFITDDNVPRITDAGRAAIASATTPKDRP